MYVGPVIEWLEWTYYVGKHIPGTMPIYAAFLCVIHTYKVNYEMYTCLAVTIDQGDRCHIYFVEL